MSGSLSCGMIDTEKSVVPAYEAPAPLSITEVEKQRYHTLLRHYFDSTLLGPYRNFNGGILVAKGGTILYEHYQGFEDLSEKKRPLSSTSSLHIASSSKPFTAVAVLQLIEQGKLSLTDTITRFFPTLPYSGITIRDLLTHRSGLPNYLYFMEASSWNKQNMATNQDVLSVMIAERPPRHAPANRRFEYCNTNYLLLALLIEQLSGKSYPEYMQQHFFTRLGMQHSFVYRPNEASRSVVSYQPNGRAWPMDYLDLTYGDKNIYSTPQDLLKWDQALYTDQLIDTSLLRQAFQGYSFERPGTHHYGLGFRLELLPSGKKVIYHFGRWHGNNAVFTRLIEEKVLVIILGNRFNRSIYSAAHHSYDLFGNYYAKDESEEDL
jgi:CubicO group peptidase (beta-lactamase class C family)